MGLWRCGSLLSFGEGETSAEDEKNASGGHVLDGDDYEKCIKHNETQQHGNLLQLQTTHPSTVDRTGTQRSAPHRPCYSCPTLSLWIFIAITSGSLLWGDHSQ